MPSMPSVDEWTYETPDAANPVGVDIVRFLTQDTDPNLRLLGDLELQYLLDVWMPKYDSFPYTAYIAAQIIAAKFAGVASVNADGVSVDVGGIFAKYTALSDKLHEMHQASAIGGEIDLSNLGWDPAFDWTIAPLVFSVDMHDNIAAGQQNFGGYGRVGRDELLGY